MQPCDALLSGATDTAALPATLSTQSTCLAAPSKPPARCNRRVQFLDSLFTRSRYSNDAAATAMATTAREHGAGNPQTMCAVAVQQHVPSLHMVLQPAGESPNPSAPNLEPGGQTHPQEIPAAAKIIAQGFSMDTFSKENLWQNQIRLCNMCGREFTAYNP